MAEYASQTRLKDRGPHHSRTSRSSASIIAPENQSGILTAMVMFIMLALGSFVLWTLGEEHAPADAAVEAKAPLADNSTLATGVERELVDPPEVSIGRSGEG